MSLRRRLAVLVAIAMTPPFLLTVYNTVRWQLFLEKEAQGEAQAAARLVAAQFEQLVGGSRQLMLAMSKHPTVPDRESECAAYFKSVIADIPIYREAAIIDSNGVFHCSTIPIPPDLDVKDRIYFREPFTSGRLTVGTLVEGRVTHAPSIHISMPYKDAKGVAQGVIVLVLDPERMASDLAARPWQPRHQIIVLDRQGSLVMTIPQDGAADAAAIAKDIFPQVTAVASGTLNAVNLKNRAEIIGFARVSDLPPSLYIAVAIDRDRALSAARITNARSLALGLITILLAIGGIWLATHVLIIRPIRAIVKVARQRGAGDTMATFPRLSLSAEFNELSTALSRMSAKINDLLEQKEFLLRELQHRVMNSLNLLSSVLDMQRRHLADPAAQEHLARARDRVVAMGTVYRYLYQTDTSDHVEFNTFLKLICEESQNAYVGANKPSIEVDTDPIEISGAHTIALAMLTHELITNAIKHAYPEGDPGPIRVSLKRRSDGDFEYRFRDQGRGLPEEFQIDQSNSLGMKVIAATISQLGGTLEINRLEPGTEFVIHLPSSISNPKGS